MPYKEKQTEKVYWTIGQVAKIIHQATSLLRFWDSDFKWLRPKKNRLGNRHYTRDDIAIVMQINWLVKISGMTHKGVIQAKEMGYYDELLAFFVEKIRNNPSQVPPNYLKITTEDAERWGYGPLTSSNNLSL